MTLTRNTDPTANQPLLEAGADLRHRHAMAFEGFDDATEPPEQIAAALAPRPDLTMAMWVLPGPAGTGASMLVQLPQTDNQHLAEVDMLVDPERDPGPILDQLWPATSWSKLAGPPPRCIWTSAPRRPRPGKPCRPTAAASSPSPARFSGTSTMVSPRNRSNGAAPWPSPMPTPRGPRCRPTTTLIRRDHRGHGLGLAVKQAVLAELRRSHPRVQRIHTWNADENQHMPAINEALGFRVTAHSGMLDWRA